MKNVILSSFAMVLVLMACNSNSNDEKNTVPAPTTTIDTTSNATVTEPAAEQLYACSMHPEVKGKKDEACYKCGMKLTVAVKNPETPK